MDNTRGYGKKALLYLLTTLFWFTIYAYQSNFSPYLSFLGASSAMAGTIIGSYGLSQLIFRIPFGIWADRLRKHRPLITAGIICAIASSLIFIFSDNLWLALAARFLVGGTAAAWVNITVLFSEYCEAEGAVKAMGTLNFINNLGQIAGMAAGAQLSAHIGDLFGARAGYKSAFALSLAAGAVCLALSFFIYEQKKAPRALVPAREASSNGSGGAPGKARTGAVLLGLFKEGRLLSVSLIAVISQFLTFGIVLGFLPEYARLRFGTGAFQNGIITVIPYIPTALGAFALSRFFSGRVREGKLVFLGMLTMAVFTALTPFMPGFWTTVAAQTIVGVGRGISFPLLMGLAIKGINSERRGTAMGFFQSVYSIGIFAGPFFTGLLGEMFSLSNAFFLCGGLCLATAVLAGFILREKPHTA